MELKSFREFLSEEYLAVESIKFLDDSVFKPFLAGKYDMTPAELKKWENSQKIIKEDDDKYWMQNDTEVELIKIYQNDPDSSEGRAALNSLVENKIPYVKSKVNAYLLDHPEKASIREDLEQEALIALTKAIEKFNPDSGNIFNAYAKTYIMGAIQNYENPNRQKSVMNGKGNSKGENRVNVVSVDTKVAGDNGEYADKAQTLGDKIVDDNQRQPWEENAEQIANHASILHDWYQNLPDQERTAMEMYFPSEYDQKPATFDEIGAAIGMSKMGAQKLVNRVIVKLRKMAEQEGFADAPEAQPEEFYDRIVNLAKGKNADGLKSGGRRSRKAKE